MTEYVIERRDRSTRTAWRGGTGSSRLTLTDVVRRSPISCSMPQHRAARYVAAERDRPVFPASESVDRLGSIEFNATLDRPLEAENVIAMLDEIGGAATVTNTGGRYFGFVTGGVEPVGLAASVLAGAWDQNAALPVMSPIACAPRCARRRLDRRPARPPHRHGGDLLRRGLDRQPHRDHHGPRCVAAPGRLGHRRRRAHRRPTDRDRRVGRDPLVGTQGAPARRTRNRVGAPHRRPTSSDGPAPTSSRLRCWRRVARRSCCSRQATSTRATATPSRRSSIASIPKPPGSTSTARSGSGPTPSPNRRHLLDGVERADSWATDCHKWLNTPYDCGVVAVADPTALDASMAMNAAYAGGDGGRSPMNLGLQMSQGARAIPVWAILATLGRAGVADAIERCCLPCRAARNRTRRCRCGGALPSRAQSGPRGIRRRHGDRCGDRAGAGQRRGMDGRHQLARSAGDADQRVRHLDHRRRHRPLDRRRARGPLTRHASRRVGVAEIGQQRDETHVRESIASGQCTTEASQSSTSTSTSSVDSGSRAINAAKKIGPMSRPAVRSGSMPSGS